MNCPFCRFELPDGSHFCSECGKDLTAAEMLTKETAIVTEPTEAVQDAVTDSLTAEADTDEAAAAESIEEKPFAAAEAPAAEPLTESPAAEMPPESAADDAPQAVPAPAVPMMESAASGTTTVYHGVLDKKPEKHSRWATIGTWGWIGILLLLTIPIVNMICLLVWSFGGARKQVKQSFARASLILTLLYAILTVLCLILLYTYAPMLLEQLMLRLAA